MNFIGYTLANGATVTKLVGIDPDIGFRLKFDRKFSLTASGSGSNNWWFNDKGECCGFEERGDLRLIAPKTTPAGTIGGKPVTNANPFVGTNWQVRADTPTPATDEREAVAVAALINALKQAGGYPATISHLKSGKFSDSISVRIAIAAIMDARAAEILAAEANERARIVAWLRATSTGLDLTKRRIADAIERNEHGAVTNEQSGVPVPSNHEGVNLVALCLAMARIKELEAQIYTIREAIVNIKPPAYSGMPHGELWEPGTSDPGSRAGLYKGFYDGIKACIAVMTP